MLGGWISVPRDWEDVYPCALAARAPHTPSTPLLSPECCWASHKYSWKGERWEAAKHEGFGKNAGINFWGVFDYCVLQGHNLSLWNTQISKLTVIRSKQFCWLIRERKQAQMLRPAMGKWVKGLGSLRHSPTSAQVWNIISLHYEKNPEYSHFFPTRNPGPMWLGVY